LASSLVIAIHQADNVAPDGEELLASTSQAGGKVFSLSLSSKTTVYFLFPFEPRLFVILFSSVKELTGERVASVHFQSLKLFL
jgi:hypothetical protein